MIKLATFINGFAMGASLIIAIGAQNAFVISQGIRREHHLLIAFISALFDSVLILLGIFGFGAIITRHPEVQKWALYGGILFLLGYGVRAFYMSFRTPGMALQTGRPAKRWYAAATTALAFAALNPHVYLDTVILLGSISTAYNEILRPYFGLGAISASFFWFFGISLMAAKLTKYFQSEASWRILDRLVATTMWIVAAVLLYHSGN